MPIRIFNAAVTVMRPWGCTLHYVGAKPFGADERRQVSLPPGSKFEKWPSTLSLTSKAGTDVALIQRDGGTVLLLGQDFLDLVHQGVLFDQAPCDAQEHATEAEYRACPDCFPPFPTGPVRRQTPCLDCEDEPGFAHYDYLCKVCWNRRKVLNRPAR